MLRTPHLYDSNVAKFPLFASPLSSHPGASCTLASPVLEMGLKWNKQASGSNQQGIVRKTQDGAKHSTANAYGQRAQERVLEEEAPQLSESSSSWKTFPGQAFPLGVSEVDSGINFAIFSQHATAVTLCLSLPERERLGGLDGGMMDLPLDPNVNKTDDIWHICIKDLPRSNVLYGYRMDGPRGWHQGHRFDSSIVLVDPYAKLVEGRRMFGDTTKKLSKFHGTYDFDSLPFDWGENYKLPNIPEKDLVIYEMNVRAYTADESSGLDPDIRGSYLGMIEKIPHLRELGINAVELLPVFEFDEFEFQRRPNPRDHMINTWGYSTINFFAPMSRYASAGGGPVKASQEFKQMVKALHGAGIEVILDVVYNHTNEADDANPYTTSFRGIDNKVYYMLDMNNNGQLLNYSGCGNTLNCNNPVVMELILDSLRHWVVEYHVDGFRFDLASVLCRGTDGTPLDAPPVIRAIAKDAILSRCKIISEPWDCGGLYLVGRFPNWDRWAEWNGKYRDDLRRFIKGDSGMKGSFATRVSGSADLYKVNKRKPYHSVNFIIAHDGFTLYDLVSYNFKHNEANGEGGNDGSNDNLSWNCGHEGETDDSAIKAIRSRQMKNFHLALMISQGTPMMLMGDEYGHTRHGNNNSYGHDTALNHFQWGQLEARNNNHFRFFKEAIKFRRAHRVFGRETFLEKDIRTKALIGHGRERGGLYYLDLPPDCEKTSYSCQVEAKQFEASEKIWLWHKRLGHPSFQYLQYLFPSLFSKVKVSDFHCETCIFSKNHRVSFPSSSHKSNVPFSLIHSDVWGPFHIPTYTGAKYFVSFIDDCTRVSWVYLLKNKSEVMSIFPIFHQMIQTQFHAKIQVVRSDNGKEYLNYGLGTFFQQHGIIHQTSCPHTPQQNGIAERKNRHLLDVARSLCSAMHVPKRFWGDAILTAVFLINRMPSRVLQFQTPIQTLSQYHSLPSLLHIPPKVFGCVCYVHVPMQNRDKLDPRAIKCVFVGYSATQKGYRCYYPPTGKFFISMDVTFREHEAFFSKEDLPTSLQGEIWSKEEDKLPLDIGDEHLSDVGDGANLPDIGDEHLSDVGDGANLPNDEAQGEKILKVYERTRKKGDKEKRDDEIDHPPHIDQLSDQSAATRTNYPEVTTHSPSLQPTIFDESNHEISLSDDPNDSNEPHRESQGSRYPIRENRGIPPVRYGQSSTKGIQYPISNFVSSHRLSDSYISFANQLSSVSVPNKLQDALKDPKWKKAMIEEMEALRKNSTWELVALPEGKKPVGCRWVFTVKHKADGSVERYKARLVAKGYTQTYGIDYQETFAPVAKINTIRVLMSLAANLGWPLRQFDVKNAFLHGDLDEEVYMDLPPGFTTTCDIGKVCRLRKSLYGLKQSPRAWFGRFAQSMRSYGFKQTQADHTLFLKHDRGKLTALIVYVDDMVVTGNDVEEIQKLQKYLAKEFEMKDLGTLKYFLGIEVARSKHGIFLSQKKYVIDLLTETGMLACKPADTPIEQNHRLGDYHDQVPANKERYQRLVGRLIYLSHTRPDIAYAVSVVSQFMHRPSEAHMDAVQRILRYLKSAPGKGLMFSNHGHQEVEGYTDADWAGSVTDRRSTSGYFTFVGGNLVTWRSKKQHVVARSSAEAEFRGMAHGVQELLWLRTLLRELGFNSAKPSKLYCDNKAAISIAHNPVQHDRTKHVEVDRHFIKERLVDGTINLPYVKSDDQLADILTKAVSSRMFHLSLSKLGIRDIYAPT